MIFILGLAELNVTAEGQGEVNVSKAEQVATEPAAPSAENVTAPETAQREVVQAEVQNTILHVNLSMVHAKFNKFSVLSHGEVISKEHNYAEYEQVQLCPVTVTKTVELQDKCLDEIDELQLLTDTNVTIDVNITESYMTHDETKVVKKGEFLLFRTRFTDMSFFGDTIPNVNDYFFVAQCNTNESTIPFALVKLSYHKGNYVDALFNCDNFARKPEYFMQPEALSDQSKQQSIKEFGKKLRSGCKAGAREDILTCRLTVQAKSTQDYLTTGEVEVEIEEPKSKQEL